MFVQVAVVITEAEAAKDFRRIPFYKTLYAFTYLK